MTPLQGRHVANTSKISVERPKSERRASRSSLTPGAANPGVVYFAPVRSAKGALPLILRNCEISQVVSSSLRINRACYQPGPGWQEHPLQAAKCRKNCRGAQPPGDSGNQGALHFSPGVMGDAHGTTGL